jgi:signal transduction protein with GAF and PtsI domain
MVKILSLQLAWQWVLRWLAVQNKWTGRALRTLTVMVLQAFSESTKIYACIVLHSHPRCCSPVCSLVAMGFQSVYMSIFSLKFILPL